MPSSKAVQRYYATNGIYSHTDVEAVILSAGIPFQKLEADWEDALGVHESD